DRWCSNRPSSNPSWSKQPNFGVNPRRVRISPSWVVIWSLTRPNRTFRANSSPSSGLTLHLRERISRRETVRDQVIAAVCRKGKVTDPVGSIEGATYQIAASLDMSRPWQDDISERHIGSSLKTLQSAFFDQVISKPAESSSSLVVAEARSGDDRKPYVG